MRTILSVALAALVAGTVLCPWVAADEERRHDVSPLPSPQTGTFETPGAQLEPHARGPVDAPSPGEFGNTAVQIPAARAVAPVAVGPSIVATSADASPQQAPAVNYYANRVFTNSGTYIAPYSFQSFSSGFSAGDVSSGGTSSSRP
jgi:hypothetical protein